MRTLVVVTSHDTLGATGRKTDGLLITGQSPASSEPAAKALLARWD